MGESPEGYKGGHHCPLFFYLYFMEALKNLAIGGGSIGSIELVELIQINPVDIAEVVKISTQIIIGIATLWAMFRKPKK